ncbi:protein gp37 [Parafrankia irregularis]|uniref:Protein gp37 n=1 Tax=Parafrankia irregularis TaxID=795642 RepID=A0A0S4R058_9ACTN|nr:MULTISPECIES: phage Gp37/Gp68 family protein [Parafrankia]MBE3206766.1 phage Gp37/Gp68 family protein [Parafrankia sp. CH37]CUU60841.1 protein gp37 [Parafrankia irregularis]
MSDRSGIEWTEATWNPTTGCDQVSAGCDHCYALTLAGRLKAMGSPKYQTDGDPRTSGPGFGVAMHAAALDLPHRWRRGRRVFVNSMSDLFHRDVTDEYIARVFAVMAATPQHTYQVLTKRPARARTLLSWPGFAALVQAVLDADGWPGQLVLPLPNVWLGVSAEDQRWADIRLPQLLDTPAAVRWVSAEPLLGPVDLTRWLGLPGRLCGPVPASPGDLAVVRDWLRHLGARRGIDWVVAGGESGPTPRPADPDWARALRDQCTAAAVPFLFKQWGGRTPKSGGRELDGRIWEQMPSTAPAVSR